jgi:hypothetical protein
MDSLLSAMNIWGDIKSRKLLIAKGLLFALVTQLAAAGLLLQNLHWETVILLLIFAWSACRFYYFLFYVLEHYAGRDRNYSGILDEVKHLLNKCRK